MFFISAVFGIQAMVGGYYTQKDWILTMPGGVACTKHDMPDMPQPVRAYAAAQAYRRWIYLCGGFQFGGDKEPPASCKSSKGQSYKMFRRQVNRLGE